MEEQTRPQRHINGQLTKTGAELPQVINQRTYKSVRKYDKFVSDAERAIRRGAVALASHLHRAGCLSGLSIDCQTREADR